MERLHLPEERDRKERLSRHLLHHHLLLWCHARSLRLCLQCLRQCHLQCLHQCRHLCLRQCCHLRQCAQGQVSPPRASYRGSAIHTIYRWTSSLAFLRSQRDGAPTVMRQRYALASLSSGHCLFLLTTQEEKNPLWPHLALRGTDMPLNPTETPTTIAYSRTTLA